MLASLIGAMEAQAQHQYEVPPIYFFFLLGVWVPPHSVAVAAYAHYRQLQLVLEAELLLLSLHSKVLLMKIILSLCMCRRVNEQLR